MEKGRKGNKRREKKEVERKIPLKKKASKQRTRGRERMTPEGAIKPSA